MPSIAFGDRVIGAARELGHPLCVGLDPYPELLPEVFAPISDTRANRMQAVERFLNAVLDRLDGKVRIVKPQIALFEALGLNGLTVLQHLMAKARSKNMVVILDAKRGDIGATAEGYARAYLEPGAPWEADALTVNPYMGLDTIYPYIERAKSYGKGVIVVTRTSNPGAKAFQNLGSPHLYKQVAKSLAPIAAALEGETGWSSVGIVAGATYPEEARALRKILPSSVFLVPGFGAQGASVEDALASFVPGPDGFEGGLVNAARSVLYPEGNFTSLADWEDVFDANLQNTVDLLRDGVARGKAA